MRRDDARRPLIFQDFTATHRELRSVPEHPSRESWLLGWKPTVRNLDETAPTRQAAEKWIDTVIAQHPDRTVGENTVGHAVMATEAAGVPATPPIPIAAPEGIPRTRACWRCCRSSSR
ncbi:MAG: hypothetical protein VX672_02080 [Planctomycetota bacterium]|nr:hypothetical protein [Planctomycetota bacterium]